MLNRRAKEIIRTTTVFVVWVLLISLGLVAIDQGDDWLLSLYVIGGSTALAGIMFWVQAQTTVDPLTDLSHTLSFIQTELHKLMDGTCSNRKICSLR